MYIHKLNDGATPNENEIVFVELNGRLLTGAKYRPQRQMKHSFYSLETEIMFGGVTGWSSQKEYIVEN